MCLKTTSAQLPTVSKSASNGTSAAFECLDEPPSACVACFHLAASTSTRVARFELSGRKRTRRWTAGQTANLFQSDASPQTQWRERGGFARKRSILFSRCSKERYAAGHVNLKEITATHNHDTNHFPVFLRLSSDFPVLPDELLAVR